MSDPAAGNPPSIVVKIANAVFGLGIVFSLVAVAFSGYRISSLSDAPESLQFYQLTLLTGLIFAALFGFGLRHSGSSKVNLALLTLSITAPIFGFEIYLECSFSPSQQVLTQQAGVLNDPRTKIEVVDDLRSTGVDAYPNVSGSQLIATNGLPTTLSEDNIYPLGAIANKTTVYCNESGEWVIFESDEHGFNNPKGLYKKNDVDIMLIGDSFAEGACVRPNESIAALLRASGLNVISLGKGGNGSLLEFASLREYAEPHRPKVVLWVHYANDISDLKYKGMESPLLMNYITEKTFSQNLISRQDEIDNVLKHHVDEKYAETKDAAHSDHSLSSLIRVFKLANLGNYIKEVKNRQTAKAAIKETIREWTTIKNGVTTKPISGPSAGKTAQQWMALGQTGKAKHAYETTMGTGSWSNGIHIYLRNLTSNDGKCSSSHRPELSIDNSFRTILMQANQIVSGWDGKLYFVWLHSRERYEHDYESLGYYREYVLCTAEEIGIPIIDIHQSVFALHPEPLSLFANRKARHYNAVGYRLVAGEIASRLMIRY